MADQRSDERATKPELEIHRSDLAVEFVDDEVQEPAPDQRLTGTRTGRLQYGAAATVTALAGVVYAWNVQRPGAWMDEDATVAACRRSMTELLRLVGNVDLVHFAYYLLARTVWQLDPSLTALRLISVVAMSLTCGLLVLIGHRLGSLRIGVVAGLLMVLSPHASRFAQEARSVALVALIATWLTWYLLGLVAVPAAEAGPGAGRRWPAAAGYAGGLVLLGLASMLALLLLVPHALVVQQLGSSRARRTWLAGALAGLVLLAPFVLASIAQRGQVAWIQRPQPYIVKSLVVEQFGGTFGGTVLVALVVLALLAVAGRRPPEGPVRAALLLGAGSALLPPLVLLGVSLVHPMYDIRYVFYTVPGTYLTVAALLAHVRLDPLFRFVPRRRAYLVTALVPALVIALFAAVGLSTQQQVRGRFGHKEDNAAVARYLAETARPGDAFVLVPTELRIIKEAYPRDFAGLVDVALVTSPEAGGTLKGTVILPREVRRTVLPYARLWLITGYYLPDSLLSDTEISTLSTIRQWYRPVSDHRIGDIGVSLVVR